MYRADLLLLTASLLGAIGWVFSKEALQGLPPFLFLGYRFLIAGSILFIVALPRVRVRKVPKEQWPIMISIGLALGSALLSWIIGLQNSVHIGVGSFLTSLGVVFAPVLGHVFLSQRMKFKGWVSLGIAIVGVAFLSLDNGFQLEPGQWLFALAGLLFGFHFALNTHYAAKQFPILLTAVQLLVTGVMGMSASLLLETRPVAVDTPIWGWLAASILIASCIRFYCLTKGQSQTSIAHASFILALTPIWVAIIGWLWFKQSMSPLQMIGCGIIFSALLLNRLTFKRLSKALIARL